MHYAELRGRELCVVCTLFSAYEDVGSIPGRRILQGILIIELNMMYVSDQRCDAMFESIVMLSMKSYMLLTCISDSSESKPRITFYSSKPNRPIMPTFSPIMPTVQCSII